MKSDCRRIRPLLGAYHDRELDEAVARQVWEHLAACPDCRRELAAIEQLKGLVQKAGQPKLAEDYWDWHRTRVWRRIRQDSRPRQPFYRPSFSWPRLATLAGGLVVVLLVVTVGRQMLVPSGRPVTTTRAPQMRTVPKPAPKPAPKPVPKPTTVAGVEKTAPASKVVSKAAAPPEKPAEVAASGSLPDEEQKHEALSPQAEATPEPEAAKAAGEVKSAASSRAGRGRWVRGERDTSQPEGGFLGWRRAVERLVAPPVATGSVPQRQARPKAEMAPASAAPPEAEITLTSIPDRISAPILPKLDLKKDATAVVKLTTDSSGRVTGAIIAKSSGVRSVDSAALEAARRSRFRPIRQGGRSFGSTFELPYHFSAGKKSQE